MCCLIERLLSTGDYKVKKTGDLYVRANDEVIWYQRIFPITFVLSLIIFMILVSKGWYGLITDIHGFRQTQTALTVSSLLSGSPFLAYETPVLGPPWSIPFEFPLYQWIVAAVVKTGLFELEQAGRFVSVFFFLSTLYPVFKILEVLKLKRNQRFLILTLYCLSPQYIFWSRTFMIESTALALGVYYLWFVTLYVRLKDSVVKRWLILSSIGIIGVFGGMVKVTTFVAFVVAACLIWGVFLFKARQDEGGSEIKFISQLGFIVFAVIIPLISVLLWTSYSDSLKLMNPIAATHLTSASLKKWNFGTLEQRLSLDTWKLFYQRTVPDLIGNSYIIIIYLLIAATMCTKHLIRTIIPLLLFLIPMLIFTNLHFKHNYYSYANGIFLIVAVGVVIVQLCESTSRFRRLIGISFFSLIVILSLYHYKKNYWPVQGSGYNFSEISSDFDKYTNPDDVIMIFGADWSSEIPYYLKRKAVMIPAWIPLDIDNTHIYLTRQNLRGYKVGSVLFSYNNKYDVKFVDKVLSELGLENCKVKAYEPFKAYFCNPEIASYRSMKNTKDSIHNL